MNKLHQSISKNPEKYYKIVSEVRNNTKACRGECENLDMCLKIQKNDIAICKDYIIGLVLCFKNNGVIID